MTNTFIPTLKRNPLYCVWIKTGNPRHPLACVWIDPELHSFLFCNVERKAGGRSAMNAHVHVMGRPEGNR
jgi:hypothetical protein